MNTERLNQIRARADAATEGPWMYGRPANDCTETRAEWMAATAAQPDAPAAEGLWTAWTLVDDRPGVLVTSITGDGPTSRENAEFIAHSRQDVPWLLAEVERLTGERDRARDREARLKEQVAAGEASDGHHTHRELYEYRMLYNAHAAHGWLAAGIPVVKSWTHSDGEPCFGGGWFIVAVTLPSGQVSNHYRAEHWGLFNIPEAAPPGYDGHTPEDAARRLRAALTEAGER